MRASATGSATQALSKGENCTSRRFNDRGTGLYLARLAGFAVLVATNSHAQLWTLATNAPAYNWAAVAVSADGSSMAAVSDSLISVSTNGGLNWNNNDAPPANWFAVACSADGSRMVAVGGGSQPGPSYRSTNSGATWVSNNLLLTIWSAVASSADGSQFVATSGGIASLGGIYISTDSGATWGLSSAPSNYWSCITCSADGTRLVVATATGALYTSADSGNSWQKANAPQAPWACLACSADGTRIIAGSGIPGATPGPVYTSGDFAKTWLSNDLPVTKWVSVASSADGTNLMAMVQQGTGIYTSGNAGLTWNSNGLSSPGILPGGGTATADGNKLVVAAAPRMFIGQLAHPHTLQISSANGRLLISWIIPSTTFVLRQTPDLAGSNWSDGKIVFTPDGSRLRFTANLPPTNKALFFQLYHVSQ